jgi:hypothetical protein
MTGSKLENTDRGKALIAAAERWLSLGASVVPAQPRAKAVLLPWRTYENQQPTHDQVEGWFISGVMNLALVCGSGGLVCLDFDNLADYQYLLQAQGAGGLCETYAERTGRGVHLFYQVTDQAPEAFAAGPIEVLGRGHLVNLAPSIHPSGFVYSVLCEHKIKRVEAVQLFNLVSEKPGPDKSQSKGRAVPLTKNVTGDLVTRIKARYPIEKLAAAVVTFKHEYRHRYLTACCPFHDDKDPSFWVDVEHQTFGCHSPSCVAYLGGDIINLFALCHKLTVNEAIRQLARGLD